MRAWIAVILMAMTVTVWADEQPKEVKRYEVALDAQELTKGVEGLADLLEKKLSGPANDYYEVVLAKNCLYGIIGTAGGAAVLLFGVWLVGRAFRAKDDGEEAACAISGMILVVVGSVVFGCHIGLLLAPEYYAMQEFLETASQFMP